MNKEYYGLVSGLRQLLIAKPTEAALISFKKEAAQLLTPQDHYQLILLFYPFDHQNMISLLQDGEYDHHPLSNIPEKELRSSLKSGFSDDVYLHQFLESHNWEELSKDRVLLENELVSFHNSFLLENGIGFLVEWSSFEITSKNLSGLHGQRRLGLEDEKMMKGGYFSEAELKRINPSDLDKEFPALKKTLEALDIYDPIERLKRIDEIRWELLEELTFFNYFGLEKILAHSIKLIDLYQWELHDTVRGEDILKDYLNSIDKELETKIK